MVDLSTGEACGQCGAEDPNPETVPEHWQWVCKHCAFENEMDDKTCKQCALQRGLSMCGSNCESGGRCRLRPPHYRPSHDQSIWACADCQRANSTCDSKCSRCHLPRGFMTCRGPCGRRRMAGTNCMTCMRHNGRALDRERAPPYESKLALQITSKPPPAITWECTDCGRQNFMNVANCHGCRGLRDYWNCTQPGCGMLHIGVSNVKCPCCGRARRSLGPLASAALSHARTLATPPAGSPSTPLQVAAEDTRRGNNPTWTCMDCDYKTGNWWKRCKSCAKDRATWTCRNTLCNSRNQFPDLVCAGCKRARPPHPDSASLPLKSMAFTWECSKCASTNWPRARHCDVCGALGGDVVCPDLKCSVFNPSERRECRLCRTPLRPPLQSVVQRTSRCAQFACEAPAIRGLYCVAHEKWTCTACYHGVDKSMNECDVCGTRKMFTASSSSSGDSASTSATPMEVDTPLPTPKAGWTCANCSSSQPDGNKFCGGCGATREGDGGEECCVVCMEGPKDALLMHAGKTGHVCACLACANALLEKKAPCPMCREPILEVIRAFVA